MSKAPKGGREIEDHHVHNASPSLTMILNWFNPPGDSE